MNPQTPGQRLYAIRLALGDGLRKAEPLAEFAARVKKATGKVYDPATISLLERDKQNWRVEDADALCRVDPERRGASWLAFGIVTARAADTPADPRKKKRDEGRKGA